MTGCKRQALSSSSLGPNAVVADLLGGRLTTDAGALLLREVGERTGLFRALDPVLQAAAGAVPDEQAPLASPATLCRLENRIDRPTPVRIAGALVDQFLASQAEPPEHLILDFDATDDPVHGHQEGRSFHGYYD